MNAACPGGAVRFISFSIGADYSIDTHEKGGGDLVEAALPNSPSSADCFASPIKKFPKPGLVFLGFVD